MERPFAWRGSSSRALFVLLTLVACKGSQPTTQSPDPTQPDNPSTPTRPDSQPPVPATQLADWPHITSAIAKDDALEARVQSLLDQMSLEEKVGQITQVEIADVTPDQVKQYYLGSVLNGGGSWPGGNSRSTPSDWAALADKLWAASMSTPHKIPIMWGTDAVHGHNNVRGATIFPHNIGMGATHDPELLKSMAQVTAREVARTGIDWAFSPTIAVVRDDRWGRTYEGFSENPAVTESYAGKIIEGLQGQLAKDANTNEKVIATAKHFLGDGGTLHGTDQGITQVTEQDLINIHGRGYYPALAAGAQTVMSSFSSWQDTAAGSGAKAYKMHGNKHLLTDVLKTKMGFDGFVISDWNGVGQITTANSDSPRDCTNDNCPWAINAGVDMVMVPYSSDWPNFITNTIASVKSGEIPMTRLDDAVRRILRVKMRAGLFEKPTPSARNASHDVGTAEDRAVAQQAVRESLVLLKNNGGVLPLSRTAKILVVGEGADNISMQTGGWTITWQGHSEDTHDNDPDNYPGSTDLWQAIKKVAPNAVLDTSSDGKLADSSYDVVVVAAGETPYAEGLGDIKKKATLEFAYTSPAHLALLDSLKTKGVKKIVTVFFSGRPLLVNKELNRSDAFVAAFLPGTEGDGMTDVLFKKDDGSVNYDFTGRLSYSWPKSPCQTSVNVGDASYDPLFAYNYGLSYAKPGTDLAALDEPTNTTGCDVVDPGGGGTTTTALSIFEGGNVDPYKMYIGAPSNYSVPVAQATASTTSTPSKEMSATPVDDRNGLQWNAVRVTWATGGQAYMQETATHDLRPYLNTGGALVFDARVSAKPSGAVKARVDCIYPCRGEIDITDGMNALSLNTWSEVAIPLSCFDPAGTEFDKVNTPFLISTSGTFELSVAHIRWEPNHAGTISCSGTAPATPTTQITGDSNVWVNGVGNADYLADPSTWVYVSDGSSNVKVATVDNGTEKVLDVTWNSLPSGVNGVVALPVKSGQLLDVSPIASTGGLQFDIQVLDYGSTTKDFVVKFVCNRAPDSCRTGDLDKLVGHPAVNTWKTVKIPFTDSTYAGNGWDATKMSDLLDILPAWDDQKGNIHFQLRNVRIVKTLN